MAGGGHATHTHAARVTSASCGARTGRRSAAEIGAALWRGRVELALIGALVALTLGLVPVGRRCGGGRGRARQRSGGCWPGGRPATASPPASIACACGGRGSAPCSTREPLAGPLHGPRVTVGAPRWRPASCCRCGCARGSSVGELDARRDQLAACLRVREVRVSRDRADGALADVMLVRRDPFDDLAPCRVAAARRRAAVVVGSGRARRR